jgi:protein-glutamine gamma-glutamyltransferase
MLGIPTRIVTGFRGDLKNRIENYLVVREEDAHAWVEVHLKDRGWIRIDPTGFATARESVQTTEEGVAAGVTERQSAFKALMARANLYVMYVKFMIQKWVLFYDRSRQMQLLRDLMNDTLLVLKFVAGFGMLIVAGAAAYITLRREPCGDRIACAMKMLLARLERHGVVKAPGEDMRHFLRRASEQLGVDLSAIDRNYHDLRYGGADPAQAAKLERLCQAFKLP